ncbi:MAG: hypothetical protein RJQ04_16025 [Longimicrobiales bacterium]
MAVPTTSPAFPAGGSTASGRVPQGGGSGRTRGLVAGRLLLAAALLASAAPGDVGAQDGTVLRPGDAVLAVDRLQPFEAEYRQMGFPFLFRLVRAEASGAWSVQMIMEGPGGVGIDHVGLRDDDLSMAYRRFAFGAFRNEYVDVATAGDTLVIHRMAREPVSDPAPGRTAVVSDLGRVFDGTVLYWLMGLVPYSPGSAWRFPTWSLTPAAAEVRISGSVRVGASQRLTLPDGSTVEARPMVSEAGGGEVHTWVASVPPYLVRQEMVAADGTVTPVIELVGVRSGS